MSSASRGVLCEVCKEPEVAVVAPLVRCKTCERGWHSACSKLVTEDSKYVLFLFCIALRQSWERWHGFSFPGSYHLLRSALTAFSGERDFNAITNIVRRRQRKRRIGRGTNHQMPLQFSLLLLAGFRLQMRPDRVRKKPIKWKAPTASRRGVQFQSFNSTTWVSASNMRLNITIRKQLQARQGMPEYPQFPDLSIRRGCTQANLMRSLRQ